MNTTNAYQDKLDKFPFLTGIMYRNKEYVGIVANYDSTVIVFYDISKLTQPEKKKILEYGETWWWESNRQIPVDIYLFEEMRPFKHSLQTFILKDTDIIFGPVTSLQKLSKKRIKRRSIHLIIKPA